MTNQPREQIEANLRRADLSALSMAIELKDINPRLVELIIEYKDKAREFAQAKQKEMALKK